MTGYDSASRTTAHGSADLRARIAVFLLFVAVLVAALISLSRGESMLTLSEIVRTLAGGGSRSATILIYVLRLPRVLMSMTAGATLALSGALIQSVLHYPLASPGTLGMVNGSSLGVVVFYVLFSNSSNALVVSIAWLPLAAFAGGMAVITVLLVLVRRFSLGRRESVVLGVALAFGSLSFTTLFMIVGPFYRASDANLWITGATNTANWNELAILGPLCAVIAAGAALLGRTLDVLRLDERASASLGVRPCATVFILLYAGLASSAAVAFVGGVSFLGLMAPHTARLLVGTPSARFLPASALVGALLLLLADLLGRTLIPGAEIPSGALVALFGAPFFVMLLYREAVAGKRRN